MAAEPRAEPLPAAAQAGARWRPRVAAGWPEALAVGVVGTLWSLVFRGFDGGRWSDIPIFKSFVDPRLYVNDPFVYALHDGTPAAYTYRFIAAVIRLLAPLPLEGALFVLYVPASILSLTLVYRIAAQLVGDRLSALLCLALYVAGFRLLTVGSAILHSAELTPAFLALPFQLGALYAFLRERHALASALAGLGVVVHAPTSSYVGLAIGLAYLIRVRQVGLRNVALAGALMVLCSTPTVVGALLQHAEPLPGWALQLARIELATDLSVAVNWGRSALLTYNLVGGLLLAVALLVVPAEPERRSVLALFAAVALLCVVAFVFIDVSLRGPVSTLVARLQLPRGVWVVNLLGLVYVAHALRQAWARQPLARPVVLVLVAGMLVSPSDFLPLEPLWVAGTLLVVAALAAERWLPPDRRRAVQLGLSALAVVAILGVAAGRLVATRVWQVDLDDGARAAAMAAVLAAGWLVAGLGRPALQARGALAAGLAVALIGAFLVRGSADWLYQARHRGGLASATAFQEWARTQTPIDSVFLILPSEPNNDTFYMNAERAVFLVRERANQAVYFQAHNYAFRERVLALGVSDVLRYREELDPAYRRLTEERIRELAARFGVTHFVPARAGNFSFPVVYQEGGWTVYAVTP